MKLSIITINLNNKSGLLATFQSIQNQTLQSFEYIVIDGASNDCSLELIQANQRIDSWISEKDTGVYDAMNKGIKIASGEYILFLNSGDYLYENNTLEKIYSELHAQDIIYGDLIFETDGKFVKHQYPQKLKFSDLFNASLGHPATFIRHDLFEKYGLYKLDYKIIADWIFFIETIAKHNASTRHIDATISVFDTNGMSSDPLNLESIIHQRNEFLQKEFSIFYQDYIDIKETNEKLKSIQSSKGYKWLKALGSKKFQY